MHIDQLAVLKILRIMDTAGSNIAGVTLLEHQRFAIRLQLVPVAGVELHGHAALDNHGHVITRVRMWWFCTARLPLFQHDIHAVRIARNGGPDGKASGRIRHADMVVPDGTGCRCKLIISRCIA